MTYSPRSKRKYNDLQLKDSGGLYDLFDNTIKLYYRLNNEEYDYVVNNLSDEETTIIISEYIKYSDLKNCLKIVEKYLKEFYEKQQL